jgi:membrane protease YdiL (CAAX protease family)
MAVVLNRFGRATLVMLGLAVTSVLTGAGLTGAAAATMPAQVVAQPGMPLALTGQVGVIAVLVGAFGLIFGLVRHRRKVRRQAEELDNAMVDTVSMDALIEVIDSAMGSAR